MDSKKAKVLKNSLIFSGLNDEEIDALTGLAVDRSFQTGNFVFFEGDDPDWFYMVATGRIKVLKHSSIGKEFVIAYFQPGEMFGEVAVLENKPYPASAQAVDETMVLWNKERRFSFLSRPSTGSGFKDY